ncbi:hypothetical protein CROQUDRAFT_655722 [Cronartium quercuum f. sp. fusiforme G11]|uniref:Uncharacterized protein n=1 Tax=Cronartium quercuum f. sp. fusiforme G11 TaxID=708437 RepID=A0A9P6TDI4_9BASI|nr:hypothetical protein CROQUDRAFT_655722 [Cronartium quercuum f. sp. fusiforme G11]
MMPSHQMFLLTLAISFFNLHLCSSFLHTSPLLAWSTAPGASMSPLLTDGPLEPFHADEQQLSLGATSSSFCPSGSSSLIILTLSSADHQDALERGYLSPDITQAYNSAAPESRLKLTHYPGSAVLRESVFPLLASRWKSNCRGKVIIEEVQAHNNIDQVFSRNLAEVSGPYTVIFTTTPFRKFGSLERRAFGKPSLTADGSKNSTMPDRNSGVLWRYSFFSDYLIIGILVVVFLLIPPVLLGAHALTAIESPKGLKTKMIGVIAESKPSGVMQCIFLYCLSWLTLEIGAQNFHSFMTFCHKVMIRINMA